MQTNTNNLGAKAGYAGDAATKNPQTYKWNCCRQHCVRVLICVFCTLY